MLVQNSLHSAVSEAGLQLQDDARNHLCPGHRSVWSAIVGEEASVLDHRGKAAVDGAEEITTYVINIEKND